MLKLLYAYEDRIPENLRALVRSKIPRAEFSVKEITYTKRKAAWIEALSWADVVLFAPGRFLDNEVLRHAKKVKLMQLWSSGFDKFNIAGATKFGIPVANNGGANASAVAEHTILLILAIAKKLPEAHRRATTGAWSGNSHGMDMTLIYKKKIGIIGFGNIGRLVAKKLLGFEATIQYYDTRRAISTIERDLRATFVPLTQLIKTSDIITLHLHHNKETESILNEEKINIMKPGAVLINVSRAQLVDQKALYEALCSERLRGAGMDVFLKEPTDGNDPMLKLPNIVATPHIAGSTYDTYELVMDRVIENFRRVASGERTKWIVNKTSPKVST